MPALDPPFDDEITPEVWTSVHQLAFDWTGLTAATRQPAADGPPPTSRRAGTPAGTPGPADGRSTELGGPAGGGPEPDGPGGAAIAGASAEAKLAVRRFVAVYVEVLNGYRPAAHLRRLSVPGEAAGVVTEAQAATRRLAELRRASGRPQRSTSRHGRGPEPVVVRRLRLCQPRAGAVEATVLLVTADRTWAVALRLERHQQSWGATTLRLV